MIKRSLSLIMTLVMLLSIPVYAAAAKTCSNSTEVISQVDALEEAPTQLTRKEPSEGVKNIVKRADQMNYIRWTPQKNIYGWEKAFVYKAGVTYTGLPYGQPVFASYVPWHTDLDGFIDAVNNPKSKMYTSKSTYNEVAPYYSVDCSAYVSWAWELPSRTTTSYIPLCSELISKTSIKDAQVGDALCKALKHVVLITDIAYNSKGEVAYVEISEAAAKKNTDFCCMVTAYGEGCELSLDDLNAEYFLKGYILYRNPDRDSVTYTHNCLVPLEGDRCNKCKAGVYTLKDEVYGSVQIKGGTVFASVFPTDNAAALEEYPKGSRVNVNLTATDGYGKLWYRTESGGWLRGDQVTFYPDELCSLWTDEIPEGDKLFIEEATFYRSAEKEFVISAEKYVEEYVLEGSVWTKYNSVTRTGVTEWPEGFDKKSELYKKYDLTWLVPVTDGDYRRTVSRPSARGYIYYHYCNGKKPQVSSTKTEERTELHYFYSTEAPESYEKLGNCRLVKNSACSCSTRYFVIATNALKYNEFRKEYEHSKLSVWSEWTKTSVTATKSTVVEKKTFYRYNDTAHKWAVASTELPSCKKVGVTVYKCTDCGATKSRYTEKTAHTPESTVTVTKKAGMNKSGKGKVLCKVCGKTAEAVKIPAITKTVQSFTTAVYDGTAKIPNIRFYDSEGNRLVYKTDFKVKYPTERIKPGTYTAKVTFMGKYEGETDITYTIKPSAVSLSAASDKNSVTLTWDDLPEATGYRVYRYNTTTKKYKALKTTQGTTYTDSSLNAGTRYYYVVKSYTKVKGEYYWSSYSKVAINTKK